MPGVDACLRAPGLTYSIVWGVSANRRRSWSLDEGRALGYAPQDDAEAWIDEVRPGEAHPSDVLVGGGFTSPGFGIDEVAAHLGEIRCPVLLLSSRQDHVVPSSSGEIAYRGLGYRDRHPGV